MAAAAPVIYTLDANDDGDITIKIGAGPVKLTTPLGELLSPDNGQYTDVDKLEYDQKEVNYMDAIKD